MNKKNIIFFLATFVIFSAVASASMIIPSSDRAKERSSASNNSPVIGENWGLERVDFIHYANQKMAEGRPKTEKCYKLLGVSWKNTSVNYVINPTNFSGLTEEFVVSAISTSAEIWDAKTSTELFNNSYEIDYNADYGVQNFKNTMVFGEYPDENVIGVTSIWFTRKGRRIVEFDILFNKNYTWGDAETNPGIMDLQNIATHELGHGIGLDDIYNSTCQTVTMYGYSGNGEIEKRTLEEPDVNGLQSMYGI